MVRSCSALVLTCAGLLLCAPALAQRPALTENIDEPGRKPYQEGQASNCLSAGPICSVDFATVPAGVRRVVTHLACTTSTGDNSPVAMFVHVRGDFGAVEYFPVTVNGTNQIASTGTLFFFDTGSQPEIGAFRGLVTQTNVDLICRIAGYDVSLP